MLRNLIARMDPGKFETRVVSMTSLGTIGKQLRESGIRVDVLGMRRGLPDVRGILPLRRFIREFEPDCLQTWLYHADLLGTFVARNMGFRPFAWNIRCSRMKMSQYGPLSGLTLRLLARMSGSPDAVVINSRSGREVHESLGFHPRRWELIPNGFDVDRFRPDDSARRRLRTELGLPGDALLIGLIARYDAMKGHDTFIGAAAETARSHDAFFVMAGPRVDRENSPLMQQLGAASLVSRACVLGERHDIPYILAGLDIACSASIGEGFPNSVGEAMSCGIPCVVTDVGDSAWLLGESAGRVVPAGGVAAFAGALKAMIDIGRDGRVELGAAGRRRIMEHFTLEAAVKQYENLYAGLVASRRARSTS